MSETVSQRDARALADVCTAGCGRLVAPYAAAAGGREMVIARYRCPCGHTWGTQWSTVFLHPASRLRRPR